MNTRSHTRISIAAGVAAASGALLVLAATCTDGAGSGVVDAGSDGGLDAGRPGFDAGPPRPPRDAGPRDAGFDAMRPPYRDAGLAHVEWERYPGLPDDCMLERAVDPSQLFVSRWEPCPGAETMCQRLVVDWAFRQWRAGSWDRGNTHTGEFGYWPMVLDYPEWWTDPRVPIVATTRGAPIAGLRSDGLAISPGMDETTYAYAILCLSSSPRRMFVYFGTPEEAFALDTPVAVIDAESLGISTYQWPNATRNLLVGVVQPAGFLFAVHRNGESRRIDGLRPGSAVQGPRLVGDHILWKEFGARWSIIHEAEDRTVEAFLERSDTDIRVFDSDGTRMVWVQSYPPGGGSSYARHEIWTAPYVRDPADIAGATRVFTVTDHRFPLGGLRLKGDRVAFVRRPEGRQPSLDLVDLETGELRRFTLPPYREEMNPWVVYLTDDEAMVHTAASGTHTYPMRIDLTRLPVVSP